MPLRRDGELCYTTVPEILYVFMVHLIRKARHFRHVDSLPLA